MSITNISLDDYFSMLPIGSIKRSIGNNLKGINHRQTASVVPSNKDHQGFTFFVRPQLNFQSDNLRNQRKFYPLLNKLDTSIQRYVRCMLDPRVMEGYGAGPILTPPLPCPYVDNHMAFIPPMTNYIKKISGWEDISAPTFTSKAGLAGEEFVMVDGLCDMFKGFDMDVVFRNTRGDPILSMFYFWTRYASNVLLDVMSPYPDAIVDNWIDYNTRAFRLVLDIDKVTVTKIASTGPLIPVGVNIAQFFDFDSETPYSEATDEITIRFRGIGQFYFDEILIKEFNDIVCIFNQSMVNGRREQALMKIPMDMLSMFNYRGYPRINPNNYELEWWVPTDMFTRVSDFVNQHGYYPSQIMPGVDFAGNQEFEGD